MRAMAETHKKITILGIETSCDETAVAVLQSDGTILSNIVLSQLKEHAAFGGVVPEIAARAHMDHITTLITAALKDADITLNDLDGVAATTGPGLVGGVMIGMMAGKSLAAAQNLPFMAVNHLEAHVLTARLTDKVEFPYLVLLVSGGHTQLLIAEKRGVYHQLGSTLDDALGECFDKSAKMMGLPYPGGPNLEKLAAQCKNPDHALERFPLPSPMKGRKNCDFSFSGLKTAVRQYMEEMPETLETDEMADLAYSFQETVCDILIDRCSRGIQEFKARTGVKNAPFAVCGGVAANKTLRAALQNLMVEKSMEFIAPPVNLCSDNGAMIAWAGIEKFWENDTDTLDIAARPRWPLEDLKTELQQN